MPLPLMFLLQAPAPLPSVALPPGLDRVLRDYERAWGAHDAAALADLFTEDGFVLSVDRPPVRGRQAIREAYAKSGGPLSLRALAFHAEGTLAVIFGAFATKPDPPDTGKFTLTLRLGADGRWRIFSDMDNGSTPRPRPASPAAALVAAARAQIGVTRRYDPRYRRIPYPGGEVPLDGGVCTDVLIRAYRAFGIDLQVLVHQDMRAAWDAYPKDWGLKRPDPNIDHRRVPNLATFFGRHGERRPASRDAKDFVPGDIVVWRLPSGVPHIGLVSDRRNALGVPFVLHNIGWGTQEQDRLFAYTLTGHYRYLPTGAQAASHPPKAE